MAKLFSLSDVELKVKASYLRKTGLIIGSVSLVAFVAVVFLLNALRNFEILDMAPVAFALFAFLVACGWWFVAGVYFYLSAFFASMLYGAKTPLRRIAILSCAGVFVLVLPMLGVMLSVALMAVGGSLGSLD